MKGRLGEHWAKRLEDLIVAGALAFLLIPVVVLAAIAVKLDSQGPMIFCQRRVGRLGRTFTLYKLRTMYTGVDEAIHRQAATAFVKGDNLLVDSYGVNKIVDDPRVTRVGRLLRKYFLDEIPQLWNVLKGDMSVVGPRPPLEYEYECYSEVERRRLSVRPGITGLWQTSGQYSLDFRQMVELDLEYIHRWSIWLDLKIITRTVVRVLEGTGV